MDLSRGNVSAVTVAKLYLFAFVMLIGCTKPLKTFKQVKKEPESPKAAAAEPEPQKQKKKKKKLYLTFDDGPNKGTGNVMDITQDEQVPVSFFIVGEHVFASKAQAEMWDHLQAADKIALCNHSYSHAHGNYAGYYRDPANVVDDFQRTHDSLRLTNSICRTPGRNIWRIDSISYTDIKASMEAADSLQKAGFVLMGWDLEWHYNPKTMSVAASADKMIEHIDSVFNNNLTKTLDHLVILAHDQVYRKSDDSLQLRAFLQKLKRKDEYEIALVTDYPGIQKKPGADSFKVRGIAP